jgi:hypothetical protein
MDDLRKAAFALLYDSLKGYQSGFVDGGLKVTGFLLIVLGWLLTSKEARDYLARDMIGRTIAVISLITASLMYASITYRVYLRSNTVFAQLARLNYLPVETYQDHVIQPFAVVIFILSNFGLSCVLAFFIMRLRRTDQTV